MPLPRCLLLFLAIAALSPTSQAQTFGPPVLTERVLVLLDREGKTRFTFSAYDAHWANPFRVTLQVESPALESLGLYPVVTQRIRLVGETGSSPLLEGSYFISGTWSVGFWYNPIHDQSRERFFQVADVPLYLTLRRDADLADLHLDHPLLRGLSAQVGYYRERGTIYLIDRDPTPGGKTTVNQAPDRLASWNVWLTQRLDVFWKNRLVMDRLYSQVVPFVSVGYYSSASLQRATSVLAGVGITYRDRLSLSGSVWIFDLTHPATRITAGLVYRL